MAINKKVEEENKIWILEIDNPPMNNLNPVVVDGLSREIKSFNEDAVARSMVITGAGERVFIGGVAIEEIRKIKSSDQGMILAKKGQELCNQIENSEKPIIAAVNALCIGGGTEILLACHLRVASEKTKFGQPEIAMGFMPGFGGTQRLPRVVGISQARRLILLGETIDAQEAYRIGLIDFLVSKEKLLSTAMNLAKKIAEKGPISILMAQRSIQKGYQMNLKDGLDLELKLFGELCKTEDMKEGLQSFIDHRKAIFKGR
ncbi:MAG TPA: enoyl-CoA hydratase-related protein [Candidatus Omnitrophota bacterium]|nr:enoyl-CoA hydratase-related protein [Candidatus Omnitrophota bacterium]